MTLSGQHCIGPDKLQFNHRERILSQADPVLSHYAIRERRRV
jgi:hypothetical protein